MPSTRGDRFPRIRRYRGGRGGRRNTIPSLNPDDNSNRPNGGGIFGNTNNNNNAGFNNKQPVSLSDRFGSLHDLKIKRVNAGKQHHYTSSKLLVATTKAVA